MLPDTPATEPDGEVTRLLRAWSEGDAEALDRLTSLVEPELRRLARHFMNAEAPGHTLQSTALVSEVYLRLREAHGLEPHGRAWFFAAAAQIMRRILVDHARRRKRAKRGGDALQVSLTDAGLRAQKSTLDVLDLHRALERLAEVDPRKARLVELRFFGGLSEEEVADVLGIPLRSAQREWSFARAYLYSQLHPNARLHEEPAS